MALVPILMRHILSIEYEYCRVYINSIALQVVVERCINNTPGRKAGSFDSPESINKTSRKAIPFSTLLKWYGSDRKYVREVVDGSRIILRTVVEGLYPGGFLTHVPVRTYFRIISVAIILLKVKSSS